METKIKCDSIVSRAIQLGLNYDQIYFLLLGDYTSEGDLKVLFSCFTSEMIGYDTLEILISLREHKEAR